MISITSSTSITSISGVVLMSIITSISLERLGVPTFMAMVAAPASRSARGLRARRRLGDERDLRDAGPLAGIDHAPDSVVVAAGVAADLHFGLWRHHRDLLQPVDELIGRLHPQIVPVDPVLRIDGDDDVLGLR